MDHPFRGQGRFLLLLLPFFGGLAGGLAAGPAWPAAAAFLVLAALLLAALRARPCATASAAIAVAGALAAGHAGLVEPALVEPLIGREVRCRARLAEMRPTEAGWAGVGEGAEIALPDGTAAITLSRVAIRVRNPDGGLSLPAEFRGLGRIYPLRSRGRPGAVPGEWAAMAMGAQYLFAAEGPKTLVLPPGDGGSGARDFFLRLRAKTGAWISRHAGTSDGALYLRALATGEVPPSGHPMVALLRRTGLAHTLAISGLNVAALFAVHAALVRLLLWLVRLRSGTPDLNRAAALAALPATWGYVLTAGAPVSAVRAAGMITAAVVLRYGAGVRPGGFGWSALLAATALFAPFEVLSPSFLLSYGATFFLVATLPERESGLPGNGVRRRALRMARGAAVAATAAFAGTLPISSAFFEALPVGSIVWNLLFGPLLGTAGAVSASLAVVGGALSIDLLGPAVGLAAQALRQALSLLALVSGDGWGYLPLPPSGILAPAVFTGAAAAGCLVLRSRGREAWPAPVAGALLFLAWIHLPYAALPDNRLVLSALDLGRGAAHIVSFPGGGHAVIDCGSGLWGDAGRTAVAPCLRARGIRRIDLLVLTHPHEDHYGGAAALLDAFDVKEIWIPRGIPADAFGPAVAARAAAIRRAATGDAYEAGGARLVVRGSGTRPAGPVGRGNENGLLLEIRCGRLSVWLPGDAEGGPGDWGPVTPKGDDLRVLFLPHHGSPGAAPAAWVRAALPDAVVSQKGFTGCFGGPNLLPSAQTFFLENGMLTIRSNGRQASFEQMDRAPVWRHLWRLATTRAAEGASAPAAR